MTTRNESEFDLCPDRRDTDSVKWNLYGDDVLPLWVADMDVRAPEAVLHALAERVAHGVFGYGRDPKLLAELVAARLDRLYGWKVTPDDLVFIPGVMPGANLACRIVCSAGESIVLHTPLYPPLRRMPKELGFQRIEVALTTDDRGRASVDWGHLESVLSEESTRVYVLCNPQNPTGRVFSREELHGIADLCLRHDVYVCSDEIHADLLHDGRTHVPIASLRPDIAERCVTLMAPSKTYNLAGLGCAFAVIPNANLRARFRAARGSLVSHVDVLAMTAASAAYECGEAWLERIRAQLVSNRHLLCEFVAEHLPEIRLSPPEGTYLAWLDCTRLQLPTSPFHFFLKEAKVALNDGAVFSNETAKYVRLNFGCSQRTLMEALERMQHAIQRHRRA